MPHGDFSDMAAFVMLAGGVQSIFYTELSFQAIGPLKPTFSAGAGDANLANAIKFSGGFMVLLFAMLFSVRWNTINGKMSGLFSLLASANLVQHILGGHEQFIADVQNVAAGACSPFHMYAVVLAIAGLHLMFNANPIVAKAGAGSKKNN